MIKALGIKDTLIWHYFQIKYAECWNEPTDGVGLPEYIVKKLESNFTLEELFELDCKAKTKCDEQLASPEPVGKV